MATKSKNLLRGLNDDKLSQFVFYLTKRYYETFMSNDSDGHDKVIEQLFFIVEEYGDKYVNLDGFICFCMYLHSNVELMKAHEGHAFKLEPLFKVDLLDEDVEELPFDIKNIFNKERIRERYNEK